jgi:hypothetical protein
MTAGQVEVEGECPSVPAGADPAANLDEAQAQRVEVQPGGACRQQRPSQGIEQPVGRRMEEQAKLLGPEAVAAETIGKAGAFEVADPLFGQATVDLPVVEGKRLQIRAVGNHEAQMAAFGELLGFEDDAARVRPGLGGVLRRARQPDLVPRLVMLLGGLRDERGGQCPQPWVRRQTDRLGDPVALAEGVAGGDSKAAVGAERDGDARPPGMQGCDEAREHGDDPVAGVDRPGAQDGRDEVVGVPVSSGWYRCWR